MIQIVNNIPQKKSQREIDFYLENGPKFGKILKELSCLIKSKQLEESWQIIKEYQILCCKTFNLYEDFINNNYFPFNWQINNQGLRFDSPICISIGNCIVHGKDKLEDYSSSFPISIDCGLQLPFNNSYLNFDAAFTVQPNRPKDWVNSPLEALKQILIQNPKDTYELASIIEETANYYNVNQVLALTGHGIGHKLHEAPIIHNAKGAYKPVKFFEGIVFCAEPIFTENKNNKSIVEDVYIGDDNWSIYTQSGAKGTHFETMFTQIDGKLVDILEITKIF